ncbi:15001_t:CDS:2 [Dentiscutata erythropus]|uniref:15001_t:CDS:1 n=1 Tax=Dentiscutata erythropus TaxID=1348616 RepID=A0A9N9IGK0_9GLOM|nr:15001_t:CDS:2 [Dentiscutata erythropus]
MSAILVRSTFAQNILPERSLSQTIKALASSRLLIMGLGALLVHKTVE